MANTKKVTNEAKATKSSIDKVADTVATQEDVVVEAPVKVRKEFKDSDYILCRSVWSGGLNVTCKSGAIYEFKNYGSECDMEYRDLVYLIRKNSDHVFTPRFVILDEDFLEDFPQVKRLYSTMYTPTELHTIIDLPINQMKAEIEKLPAATKKTLLSLVATEVASGRLDSIKKVKALSEIFESDFNLLSELFNN